MDIVILGSGNVATVLGQLVKQSGHTVRQVYSRKADHAALLARQLGTQGTSDLAQLDPHAALYIIAVADHAIHDLARELRLPGRLVVHTAASVGLEPLEQVTSRAGVLYPLQSIRKTSGHIPLIPFFIDGVSEEVRAELSVFASTLSSKVQYAGFEERIKLHVAAVFVSNFTNHLYAQVEEFCRLEKLDFTSLWPLIQETAERLQYGSPADLQTGPAQREDWQTIQKHLSILDAYPHMKQLYNVLSESIISSKKGI